MIYIFAKQNLSNKKLYFIFFCAQKYKQSKSNKNKRILYNLSIFKYVSLFVCLRNKSGSEKIK